MKILVLGGAGYTGSVLVQKLLARGDQVTVLDTFWFGDWLVDSPRLSRIVGDIRNPGDYPEESFDSVVHLANIANDPGVELYPELSWEVNVLATKLVCDWAVRRGIPQIIYASSGSVYGIKTEERVTEDLELVPISTYNKTKMVAERVLLSYRDHLKVHIVRPATVCGVSPRMRFDVVVNLLVLQAFKSNSLSVFGGNQVRPNIEINDLARVYMHFLDHPDLPEGAYNAGFENLSVSEIGRLVSEVSGAGMEFLPSDDPRSYRQDSSKLIRTGFSPRETVRQTVEKIFQKLLDGNLGDRDEWHTVEALSRIMGQQS